MKLEIEKEGTLTYQDLANLWNQLQAPYMNGLEGRKVNWAIGRNLDRLKPIIKALQKIAKYSPEYSEYEKKVVAINEGCALKDANGMARTVPDPTDPEHRRRFYIPDPAKKVDREKRHAELQEQFKEPIAEYVQQIKDYEDTLEEIVPEDDFRFYTVKFEEIPENIKTEVMMAIRAFVIGGPEPPE